MTAIEVQELLGKALFKLWPSLPEEIQERLFDITAPQGEARMAMAAIMQRSGDRREKISTAP